MAAALALASLKATTEKNLTTALNSIPKLHNGSFDKTEHALRRHAFAFEWADWIFDPAIPEPAAVNLTDKEGLDKRNVYLVVLNLAEGHQVQYRLEAVAFGDAKTAYATYFNYFHRNTHAGRQQATGQFYNASMSSENINIVEWMALVERRAGTLVRIGGRADAADQLTVMVSGLLPEFLPLVTLLNADEGLTMESAQNKILDFASSNNLLDTTKSGKASQRNNTFLIQKKGVELKQDARPREKVDEDCRLFAKGKCYRKNCIFNHRPGAAANVLDAQAASFTPPAPAAVPSAFGRPTVSDATAIPHPDTDATYAQYQHKDVHSANIFTLEDRMASSDAEGECITHVESPPKGDLQDEEPPERAMEAFAIAYRAQMKLTKDAIVSPKVVKADLPKVSEFKSPEAIVNHSEGAYFNRALLGNTLGWLLQPLFLLAAVLVAAWSLCTSSLNKSTFGVVGLLFVAFALCPSAAHAEATSDRVPSAYFNNGNRSHAATTQYEWCCDSGTNRFVTNDDSDFVPSSVKFIDTKVAVGGGNITSQKVGTVVIRSLNHNHIIHCEDVLYIPECSKKLMPTFQFLRKGCKISFDGNQVLLSNSKYQPMFSGKEIGGLYYFKASTHRSQKFSNAVNKKLASTNSSTLIDTNASTFFGLKVGDKLSPTSQDFASRLLEAHWSYGHLHFNKLRAMLGLQRGTNPECPACTLAKSRITTLESTPKARSTRAHHRMHMDIGFTQNKKYVFQLCIDDFSRFGYIDMLDSKDQALMSWINLKNHLEKAHFPAKFAFIKTDSEPLYQTPAWDEHVSGCDLEHEFSSRYRHDQNGVAERAMQTIGIAFRAMMFQGNAPDEDIPHCLRHANIVRNDSPSTANGGRTPREKLAGTKLAVNQRLLRGPLFCLVYAHVYEAERTKNAPRGVASIYLGYDASNNAYLVKEIKSGCKYYTADLTFHPNTFPYRANPDRSIELLSQFDNMAPHITTDILPFREGPNLPLALLPQAGDRRTSARQHDYSHSGGIPILSIPDAESFFTHSFGPDPANEKEARAAYDAAEWIAAILAEQNSLKQHNVYQVIKRSEVPTGKRVFYPKMVLKRKLLPPTDEHPSGSIEKHKCRLTVAAYTKMLKQGIDYEEKHASTVRWDSLKILIAIAVKFGFDIVLYDISSFFLYGRIIEGSEMYMFIPAGWEGNESNDSDNVWKLHGTLYGMPNAPHEAQKVLRSAMAANKLFRPTTADDCVYVTQDHSTGYCASGTHVDDTMAVGDEKGLTKLASTLENRFKITSKRNPTVITGVQVERNRSKKWLKLHQEAYSNALLAKYDRSEVHHVDTPMDPGTAKALMMLETESGTPATVKKFQEIVGGLMWLMRTRPDLHFTIQLLCRFLTNATQAHIDIALGRPMKYLAGTTSHGLVFMSGQDEWVLSGASDADLAGDLSTSRSTIGLATILGEFGCVSSRSVLERKVCNSTGMSETFAHQALGTQVIWNRHLLSELGFAQTKATVADTDNEGVKNQSTKAINHAGAKHYRIAQAMVRQLNVDEVMKTRHVDTEANYADMLTKALPTSLFQRHKAKLMGPQTLYECSVVVQN